MRMEGRVGRVSERVRRARGANTRRRSTVALEHAKQLLALGQSDEQHIVHPGRLQRQRTVEELKDGVSALSQDIKTIEDQLHVMHARRSSSRGLGTDHASSRSLAGITNEHGSSHSLGNCGSSRSLGGITSNRGSSHSLGGITNNRGSSHSLGGITSNRGSSRSLGGITGDRGSSHSLGGITSNRGSSRSLGGITGNRGSSRSLAGIITDRGSSRSLGAEPLLAASISFSAEESAAPCSTGEGTLPDDTAMHAMHAAGCAGIEAFAREATASHPQPPATASASASAAAAATAPQNESDASVEPWQAVRTPDGQTVSALATYHPCSCLRSRCVPVHTPRAPDCVSQCPALL